MTTDDLPTEDEATTVWIRLARRASRARGDLLLATLDAVLAVAAYGILLMVRVEGALPAQFSEPLPWSLGLAVVAHLAANWVWGLYGQMWRHASVQEARRVVLAGLTAAVVLGLLVLPGPREIPLSVLGLGAVATTAMVGMLRFHTRLFAFRRGSVQDTTAVPVAVYGAGDAGAAFIREAFRSPAVGIRPVAVLDDDPSTWGRAVLGVPVLGGIDAVARAVSRHGARQVVLADPSASGARVREVARAADAARVPLKVLPAMDAIVNGSASVRDVRDLEIRDLLGRNQVETDLEAVRELLEGRTVLVTGAGGSIGSEICRQVAASGAATIVMVDHDETHLHDAATDLDDRCVQVLADIRDRKLVRRIIARHRPDIVFHTAAHKHVPMLEAHPVEAAATNVLGTRNVVRAAADLNVERFVLISTDKAVEPVSVMGASKRVAEQLVLSAPDPPLPYCAVRFGNVLGSRGSVIPRFARQIQRGGPVTVTDPRMDRYFMSIEEAVQLVLQAAVFARGSEIFMLDMGEPVRIMELAERMIRLSGREVGVEVPIRIIGTRAGERLSEPLRTSQEQHLRTAHPSITALYPPMIHPEAMSDGLERLARAVAEHDDRAARQALVDLANERRAVIRLDERGPERAGVHDTVPSEP